MPNPFAITTPTNTALLDAKREAAITFTVTNIGGVPLRGRADLVAQDPQDPKAAKWLKWLTLEGESERQFDIAQTQQYVAKISVPPDAPAGTCPFQLEMVDVNKSDENRGTSPTVTFQISEPVVPPRPFPWWIIVVVLVLLIMIGALIFFLTRPTEPSAPTPIPPSPIPPTLASTSVPPSPTATNTTAPSATPTPTSTTAPSATPKPTNTIAAPAGVSQVLQQISISGGGTGQAVAACPAGTKVTGGGFATSGSMNVYSDAMEGNGWEVAAKNNAGGGGLLNGYAICVSNLPGTVKLVFAQSNVAGNATGQTVIACPAGTTLTGGGFAANVNMETYSNANLGNSWESAAKNNSAAPALLNAYALCYDGPGASSTSVVKQVNIAANSNGNAVAACLSGKLATGGGYAANSGEIIFNTSQSGSSWQTFASNTTGASQLLNSYVICTGF